MPVEDDDDIVFLSVYVCMCVCEWVKESVKERERQRDRDFTVLWDIQHLLVRKLN